MVYKYSDKAYYFGKRYEFAQIAANFRWGEVHELKPVLGFGN